MFLGVDSSLRCPGAVLLADSGALIRAGHLKVKDSVRGGQRLAQIHAWLSDEILSGVVAGELTGAAIEGPSLGSTHLEYDLGSAYGVCVFAVYVKMGIECRRIEPSRLKKFATSNGQASKDEVLHAVKDVWGVDLTDDNEGDAYVLARIARALVHKDFTRRCQAEIIRDITQPTTPKARKRAGHDPENI